MAKKQLSANFFRRMTLGMSLVSSLLYAYDDGKLTKDEIVMVLNQLFIGLGMEVDFGAMAITEAEDGGIDIHFPPEVLSKLS